MIRLYTFIKQEKTTKGKVVLLGHSLGGLIALLTQQQATNIDQVIVVEASITEADKNFFRFVQELPTGIGFEKFIQPTKRDKGYILNIPLPAT